MLFQSHSTNSPGRGYFNTFTLFMLPKLSFETQKDHTGFFSPSLSLIFRTKLMLLRCKSLHWSSLCSHTSSLMASHPWILDTLPFTPQCKYDEPAWRGFKETNNEIWEYLYGFHIYQIEKILGYTSSNTMQEWRHGCNLHMQKLIILPNDIFQQSHTKITAALWCSSAFV